MKPIFSTARFNLREKKLSDAHDMYLLNANLEVIRYTGDAAFKDVNEAEEFIKKYDHFHKHKFGRWVVEDRNTKEYLGWCGLKKHADGMIDLGYRIKKEHWGKGIASECAAACLDYGFRTLAIKEIVGRSVRANIASIRILEKIGMQYWKDDTCDGLSDAVWYRIDKSTYLEITII